MFSFHAKVLKEKVKGQVKFQKKSFVAKPFM